MAEPDTVNPALLMSVFLPDGRQTTVLEILPAIPEAGVPVRVWLAGDSMNLRREWPEILETCRVQP